ncbi:MAG TPA: hypothetical protein VHQ24_12105 [Lachnospiraceae bacterium]|nr:hypothetical protein [Lachnospiraceae bacterium]HEX3077597.1 hypothetical protein [Lachnospiraceae bacterium]
MYTNVCKHCRKVFKSRVKQYSCKECESLDIIYFESIINYLKKYPNSNALQISEALGISAFEVLQYMKEGRLYESKGFFEQI